MNEQAKQTSSGVCAYLKKLGYDTVDAEYYKTIQNWMDWYMNSLDDNHKTQYWNGVTVRSRVIKSLGMAKTVCETWANLLMNEKVQIAIEPEAVNTRIHEILDANDFEGNTNELCEKYCALGSGAFLEYMKDDEIFIDYIMANMIYPLSWDSTGIKECAFASQRHDKSIGDYLYIQMHVMDERGMYQIENHMIQIKASGSFDELPLPEGMEPITYLNTNIPLFQIVKPKQVNNVDIYNPMGISVYANAIDVLKEIDTTFDAFDSEVRTGRRHILMAGEGFTMDANGNQHNVIDDNEEVLRMVGEGGSDGGIELHDFSPSFRISELKEALQFLLNLLSEKCGMGTNQYEFATRGVKTATEVISEDSDMYSTLKKHEKPLDTAIRGMIRAIGYLMGTDIQYEDIQIDFDDSIIEDKETERRNDQTDLANGTLRPEEYRSRWRNESIEEALKNLPQQADVLE